MSIVQQHSYLLSFLQIDHFYQSTYNDDLLLRNTKQSDPEKSGFWAEFKKILCFKSLDILQCEILSGSIRFDEISMTERVHLLRTKHRCYENSFQLQELESLKKWFYTFSFQ